MMNKKAALTALSMLIFIVYPPSSILTVSVKPYQSMNCPGQSGICETVRTVCCKKRTKQCPVRFDLPLRLQIAGQLLIHFSMPAVLRADCSEAVSCIQHLMQREVSARENSVPGVKITRIVSA
jgi:hypothetical protein